MSDKLEKDWKVIKGEISKSCCTNCGPGNFHPLYFNNRADNIILKVCNTGSCTMRLRLTKKCGGTFTDKIILPPADTGKNCSIYVLEDIISVDLQCENGEHCCGCYEIQRNFLRTKNSCDY